jgi:transposase InsO family protein
VWAGDVTNIPVGHRFVYLVAIMDWASRAVLSWRLPNTMDVSFCVAALEEALQRFGKPQIFNMPPVHQHGLYRPARTGRHPNLDGWLRALD